MTDHTDHDAQAPAGAGSVTDWRAAWKAARGETNGAERGAAEAGTDEATANTANTQPRQRWSSGPDSVPEPDQGSAWSASRTATSTLEANAARAPRSHRASSPDAAIADAPPRDGEGDGDDGVDGESATETTGSLRAVFAQGLARAKALVEGRAAPDASGAAAGSLSPRVAAEIEATMIPPVTATGAVHVAPAAAAAAPAVVAAATAPAVAASAPPAVVPAPPAAAPAPAPRRGAGRIRRAHLKVTRIDPWTVMKVSFMLSIAFGIMTVVAVAIVWSMLDAAGVFTSLNDTIASVTGGGDSESTFNLLKWVGFDRVIGVTTLIAVVDVVLITALATLGAFLYNLGSALIGGVEVTLVEDQR